MKTKDLLTLLCFYVVFFSCKIFGASPVLAVWGENQAGGQSSKGAILWSSPAFAAYSNGKTIWRKNWVESMDSLVSGDKKSSSARVLNFIHKLEPFLGKVLTISRSSDPEITLIWLEDEWIEIRGSWDSPKLLDAELGSEKEFIDEINQSEIEAWNTLPAPIKEVLSEIYEFCGNSGESWIPNEFILEMPLAGPALGNSIVVPDYLEKMLRSFPESEGKLRAQIPGNMLNDVLSIVEDARRRRAVLVGGKSRYGNIHLLFPGSEFWEP